MRLIDADALKKAMDGYWGRCQRIRKPRNGETAVFLDIKAIVEDCPTIDAVPVIRCKDCKWHQGKDCMAWDDGTVAVANEVEDDGYCYLAERKEE